MELPEDPRVREAVGIAMKSLARRPRLSAEIAWTLRTRGFSEEEARCAVDWLEAQRLLNDEGALHEHLAARSGKRSVGSQRLRNELERRGATEAQIAALVTRTDEEEASAMQLALEGRRWQQSERAKAGRFLASRGFDSEVIEGALDRFFGSED